MSIKKGSLQAVRTLSFVGVAGFERKHHQIQLCKNVSEALVKHLIPLKFGCFRPQLTQIQTQAILTQEVTQGDF